VSFYTKTVTTNGPTSGVGFFSPAVVNGTASCNAGDFVIGGGFTIDVAGYASASYPSGTTWKVSALVYADNAKVMTYAICADITP
jgi:hypothetical protein